VRRARTLDGVIVATSTAAADDAIEKFCLAHGVTLFRGSESNVLDRYHQAATMHRAATVVRITADCPLIDPQVIDRVVEEFSRRECDYAANVIQRTYPHGLDTEVFKFGALTEAWREALAPAEREHVTPYLRDSGRFTTLNVECEIALAPGYYRWTVDEASDLEFVRAVYACLGTAQPFDWRTVIELLDAHPEIAEINAGVEHPAGFLGAHRQPGTAGRRHRIFNTGARP
jgi:spore coat polysaccharide biosynthesis protein SpsF (cytidylyltransferase family)